MRRIFAFALSFAIIVSCCGSLFAFAGDSLPASGDLDSLHWEISAEGVLSISGSDTVPGTNAPWLDYADQITSIVLDESVLTIENRAFQNCSHAETVSFPSKLTKIGLYAFSKCAGLKSVLLPDSVTEIGSYAFSDCSGVTEIKLPAGGVKLGEYVFNGCAGLRTAEIPEGVTSIPGIFYKCTGLTSVQLPDSLTEISEFAFSECTALQTVSLPDGITALGRGAFSNCKSITAISIPNSVKELGDSVFSGCKALEACVIPAGVRTINDNAFYGCNSLESVSLPESVISIGTVAFLGCVSLTSVSLPEGLESIGERAFFNCSNLTSVKLPKSLKTISNNAFVNCSKITSVQYSGDEEDRGKIAIGNQNTALTDAAWTYFYHTASSHIYDNNCDTECNECGHKREISHYFGKVQYSRGADNKCTAVRECQVCGEKETETVEPEFVDDTPATCLSEARGHWKATFANTAFGIYETTANNSYRSGSKLPHDFTEPVYTWDGDMCTATRTCKRNCGKTETETVQGEYVKDTDASTTENEKGHYSATFKNECLGAAVTEWDTVEKEGTKIDDPYAGFIRGDVDGNGKIESKDYIKLKRYVLGTYKTDDSVEILRMNVDRKGGVDSKDYVMLKRVVLGTYTFPES